MVILQAAIGDRIYFFCGPDAERPLSTDRDAAKPYVDDAAARTDLARLPFTYSHFKTRAAPEPL